MQYINSRGRGVGDACLIQIQSFKSQTKEEYCKHCNFMEVQT